MALVGVALVGVALVGVALGAISSTQSRAAHGQVLLGLWCLHPTPSAIPLLALARARCDLHPLQFPHLIAHSSYSYFCTLTYVIVAILHGLVNT